MNTVNKIYRSSPLKIAQAYLYKIKNNRIFEMFVIFIIIISALEIGAKTYALPSGAALFFNYLDTFVTFFFLIEITIRFLAEPEKKSFFRNGWNVFDALVVIVSIIPINDTEMILLARLIRIFRVLRMISVIPELRILINSLIKAMPQLGYVMLLMFIIFYIYAAIGSLFFSPINTELWGNISISLLTLFRIMTFEDWTDIMYQTNEVFPLSWIYYLSFIFFTAFAFLNMVIGIVVNVMVDEKNKMRNDIQPDVELRDLQIEIHRLQTMITDLSEKVVNNDQPKS